VPISPKSQARPGNGHEILSTSIVTGSGSSPSSGSSQIRPRPSTAGSPSSVIPPSGALRTAGCWAGSGPFTTALVAPMARQGCTPSCAATACGLPASGSRG
jgi:hypothetical protein